MSTAAARRRSSPPEDRAATRRSGAREKATSRLVLIVDDSEDNRDLYTEALAAAGWRVAHAVDGEHALLKVGAIMPDVIVMDLAMPVLDGWEATRQIKIHPKTKHIPVVVLTGQASPDGLHRARKAGAAKVLIKPFAPDALVALLDGLVTPD